MSVYFSRTCSSLTPALLLFSRRQEKYRIHEPIMPVPPQATASPYPVSTEQLLVSDSRVILVTCSKSGDLGGGGWGVGPDESQDLSGHTVLGSLPIEEHEAARYAAEVRDGGEHRGDHRPPAGWGAVVGAPCEQHGACREETHYGDAHHHVGGRHVRAVKVAVEGHDDGEAECHGEEAGYDN